ncbi:MAG: DUF2812 domain-containing protein [Oscillospiraceae bacterium]|nr:DUF2812 domain-containing protein [Oscillospiraceae bacterium]
MKSTKREIGLYSFYDHTGIRAHLEQMAAKGWMLEKMGNWCWRYRRTEPRAVRFAVVYFPTASDFDSSPGEDQQTFRDYCAAAGWKPVASWAQMLIFANESDTPVPIETDAAVQLDNIHRAMKRNFLPGHIVLLALYFLQMGMQLSDLWKHPADTLARPSFPLFMLCWPLAIAYCAAELTSYFLWRRRARRAAELDGSFTPTRGRRGFQAAGLVILVSLVLLWLFSLGGQYAAVVGAGALLATVLLQCSVNGIKALMKRSGCSTGVNRAVTVAASFVLAFALISGAAYCAVHWDEFRSDGGTYTYQGFTYDKTPIDLPLTTQDLTGQSYEHVSRNRSDSQSVFLARSTCWERVQTGASHLSLSYEITDIRQPWLRDVVVWDYLENTGFSVRVHGAITVAFNWDWLPQEAPERWGADAVYRKCWDGGDVRDEYLLFFGDRVVDLTLDEEPTPAQMAVIGENLRTA